MIPAVSASTQPLVTITQVQPIKVSFMLPQNGLAQIQNQFNQQRLKAVVPMAGAPGGAETAPVDFVSNAVSASTGTIELRADFPNADMRLVPGQTVTVAATINQIPGATRGAARCRQSGTGQQLRAGGGQGRQGLVQTGQGAER